MKQSYDKGYLRIELRNENGRKMFRVHRIVAGAFIPGFNNNSKLTINHKNFIKDDNCAWNLEVMSRSMNSSIKSKGKNTSKYLGVCWHQRSAKWVVNYGNKSTYLGSFTDEKEAARFRDQYIIDNNLDLDLNDISDSDEE